MVKENQGVSCILCNKIEAQKIQPSLSHKIYHALTFLLDCSTYAILQSPILRQNTGLSTASPIRSECKLTQLSRISRHILTIVNMFLELPTSFYQCANLADSSPPMWVRGRIGPLYPRYVLLYEGTQGLG